MSVCKFLELGAAALLVGDMEDKTKGQPWKYFGTADLPYLDQLLQPSSVTTITNSASARRHLRTITSSKRSKAGPHQIWYVLLPKIFALSSLENFVPIKIRFSLTCKLIRHIYLSLTFVLWQSCVINVA